MYKSKLNREWKRSQLNIVCRDEIGEHDYSDASIKDPADGRRTLKPHSADLGGKEYFMRPCKRCGLFGWSPVEDENV